MEQKFFSGHWNQVFHISFSPFLSGILSDGGAFLLISTADLSFLSDQLQLAIEMSRSFCLFDKIRLVKTINALTFIDLFMQDVLFRMQNAECRMLLLSASAILCFRARVFKYAWQIKEIN